MYSKMPTEFFFSGSGWPTIKGLQSQYEKVLTLKKRLIHGHHTQPLITQAVFAIEVSCLQF